MRSMTKQIDQADAIIAKNRNIDITAGEMKQFLELFREYERKHDKTNALFYLIDNVFSFGLAVGYRAGSKKK